jgi:predicted nucleotidyltransferase
MNNSQVDIVLGDFMETAKASFGESLRSAILFGSAAEGRLRPSSDVNLMLVLREFVPKEVDGIRESLRTASAAIHLSVMFILENEIAEAAEAFAVKFMDIANRHKVLHGSDPFANLKVSREHTIQRLEQVLVNLHLRLRERYAMTSLREEQLARVIADMAGPVRASAASILGLEGKQEFHPKEALEALVQRIDAKRFQPLLASMSRAREEQYLPPGEAPEVAIALMDLIGEMRKVVEGLAK